MLIAPVSPKEKVRAAAVKSLRLMDTPPEERFDRITRLSQRLFNVPMVGISLIGSDREWQKSAVGLDSPSFARDISIGAHAILEDDVMTVVDACQDQRFADNPLVSGEPKIRFYAGCPLTAKNGAKVGVLHLMDKAPRDFSDDDRALLRALGQIAEKELQGVQLNNMDRLTSLSNRRGFEDLSQHALNICRRFNKPASLLYFSVDRMGDIRRKFGDAEADMGLKQLARIMIKTFRASDVIGRLDDDQFVVLMTDTTRANAGHALARLDAALAQYNHEAGRGFALSYSVGSLEYDTDVHPSITGLLGAADMAMYETRRRQRKLAEGQVSSI